VAEWQLADEGKHDFRNNLSFNGTGGVAEWQLAFEGKPDLRNKKNCLLKNPRMPAAKPATPPVSQTFRI
jgi:hypothetical protein